MFQPRCQHAIVKTSLVLAIFFAGSVLLQPVAAPAQALSPTKVTHTTPGSIKSQQTEDAHGDKPRVAVKEFTDKSARGGAHLGDGMKEQLVTALSETNAFIVLERAALDAVMAEQDLGKTGRFRKDTVATTGELEGADFLIYGAVTEYDDSEAGGRVSTGGVPVPVPFGRVVGPAVSAGMNQAHVAIDLRLIDARTGRVVNSTSVEGSPRDLGGTMAGRFAGALVRTSARYKTPREKAVRACMIKAVNFIAANCLKDGVIHADGTDSRARGASARPTPAAQSAGGDSARQATPAAAAPAEEAGATLKVKGATIVHFKPSATSLKVNTLAAGSAVEVLGEEGEYVKVRPKKGNSGWILKSAMAE